MVCQREAVDLTWHMNVGEEQVDIIRVHMKQLQRLGGMCCFKDAEALIGQDVDRELADQRLVFCYNDSIHLRLRLQV